MRVLHAEKEKRERRGSKRKEKRKIEKKTRRRKTRRKKGVYVTVQTVNTVIHGPLNQARKRES